MARADAILEAIDNCVSSAANTPSDATAERCARAARDLAEVFSILSELGRLE